MANPEQRSSPEGNNERRLVFDEKRGKWTMKNIRTGHPRGQPISLDHANRLSGGLKQYWQKRREAGNAPLSQQHSDRVSEGLKRYWQKKREQQ